MRRIIAGLMISFVVFPLLLATVCLFGVRSWILDRTFYEKLLADEGLYEPWAAHEFPLFLSEELARVTDRKLPTEALSAGFWRILPSGYLPEQARGMLGEVFDRLEGRRPKVELRFDLQPIEAALQGDGLSDFVRTVAAQLPACSGMQEAERGETEFLGCRPTDVSVDRAAEIIARQMPAFLAEMPREIVLGREIVEWEIESATGWLPLPASRSLTLGLIIMAVATCGLWLAAGLIGGYSSPERLRWLGWALIIPAVLVCVAGLSLVADIPFRWTPWTWWDVVPHPLYETEGYRWAVFNAYGSAIRVIGRGFLAAGGIAAGLAVGLFFWSAFAGQAGRKP